MPFLNQQKGENDRRKYFMINLYKRMLPTRRGLNLQPPDILSDAHPTEPLRPVSQKCCDEMRNSKISIPVLFDFLPYLEQCINTVYFFT